ncbi:PTS sugar transporter subunit IIBC [Sphingobacterium sp. DN00404]|uniref:PTS sugar transporter subunit IIBC n=1 Tax=Sphingobacterium micropteri TaxID=2763501 RepID=A0ABR7YTE7_9SPHI|nr:PTS sugar transporter subunit IIBC [Sphingobacterium micropteri]MBD1434617.1 PTS sugar transporter subunit IIBC [Sphingobacterium micropteri]
MSFIDKKVSDKRAIVILAKSGIQVSEEEANIILDFLYLVAKNYNKPEEDKEAESLRRNRTLEKRP